MIHALTLMLAAALGAGVSRYALHKTQLPNAWLLHAACALPLGFAIASLAMFGWFFVAPEHAATATLLCMCAGIAWTWRPRRGTPSTPAEPSRSMTPPIVTILALALLAICLADAGMDFVAQTARHPHGGGDAMMFWHVKARFLHSSASLGDPSLWRLMFDEDLAYSHPDYPLLMPGTIAFGWALEGSAGTTWPMLVALSFWLSTAALLLWFVASRTTLAIGCVAAAFFVSLRMVRAEAPSQYADLPLGFFMSLAAFMLVTDRHRATRGLLALTGLAAGAAAWTKAEGMPFFGLAVGASLWLHHKRSLHVAWSGAVPVLAALVVSKVMTGASDYSLDSHLDLDRLPHTLSAFASMSLDTALWSWLWWLFATAVLLGLALRRMRFVRDPATMLAVLVLAQTAVYTVAYLMSPHPLAWHIRTSMARLILHMAAIGVAFAVVAWRPRRLDELGLST